MNKKNQQATKGNFTVRITATVTKELYCIDCTEEEARSDPWNHCESERELSQSDYEVLEVEQD